jgi:signal transduction histidine kinase/CheY-like chemotaxis protein
MDKKINVILYAIIIGILFYILDAVIFYLEFSKDYSFFQALLTNVPFWEVFGRLLVFTVVIIIGIIINGIIRESSSENQLLHPKPIKVPHGQLDFNFLSSLSYQIRTPLNAIIGFSELLKKPNLSPESKDIYVNHISSSSKYLLLLINNLSEISKIESNELTIVRSEANVNKIIGELYEVFQTRKEELGKPGISFVIEKVKLSEVFTVLTDPERFKQVLHNLLDNALLTTDKGIIKLGYSIKDNGILEFYVKDTGRGFSQERLETIFARYNKLTDNQNMPFDGSVLRLAISKSLVKLLGGEIWADSKLGQGTVIFFTLPYTQVITKPLEETVVKKVTTTSNTHDWSDRLILISEDVESNYIYLEELLRSTKVNILWAKNGKEAVEFVKTNPKIEMVLMDILMPEMDGYQASREIKKIRKELPIVAQTACMIEGNEENAKNFDSYLTKPIWAPQLYSSIEKYIH